MTQTKVYKYYDLLASVFIVVLVISNLVGQKICAFGPFRVSGAQLLFPITYIFGDVFTEVYGYGGSRRVIWIGFLANALMAMLGNIIVALPPAPEWKNQEAFATDTVSPGCRVSGDRVATGRSGIATGGANSSDRGVQTRAREAQRPDADDPR